MRIRVLFLLAISLMSACGGPKTARLSAPTNVTFGTTATSQPAQSVASDPEQALIRAKAAEIDARKAREEAEKNLRATETPSMRQARKEIVDKRKRVVEAQNRAASIMTKAEILGCDPASVIVHPEAEKGSRVFGHTLAVRVVNDSALSLNIQTSYKQIGWAVKNLCPGGSLTLSFYLEFLDPDYLNIPLKAVARSSSGAMATEERTFSLYRSYNGQTWDSQVWDVHLNIQYTIR